MTNIRIGLFGNFGTGNLGNEGSLDAMVLFLRRTHPDADVVCFCMEPDVVMARHDIEALPVYARRSGDGAIFAKIRAKLSDHLGIFRHLRNIAVLLIPGTGVLDDFGERPIGFPYTLFLVCLAARLRGIDVAFVSVGAGPIRHPISRWLMKQAARMAAYRSYRDDISKEFMASIGLRTGKDPVYPDLAFSLPGPSAPERPKGNALQVGLGVMAYYGWNGDPARNYEIYASYIGKLARFAAQLLQSGHSLRLLIGEDTDRRAVDDLVQAVTRKIGTIPPGCIVAEIPRSLPELMEQIACVDAVIATRFHNVLCALKLGKPTISLGYARKNDVLMQRMGLGEFCQHIETFDVDILMQQFATLGGDLDAYQQIVRNNAASLQRELAQQEEILIARFLSPST